MGGYGKAKDSGVNPKARKPAPERFDLTLRWKEFRGYAGLPFTSPELGGYI
jgi:hypothetical protein